MKKIDLRVLYEFQEKIETARERISQGAGTDGDKRLIYSYYNGPSYSKLFSKRSQRKRAKLSGK